MVEIWYAGQTFTINVLPDSSRAFDADWNGGLFYKLYYMYMYWC